MVYTRSMTRNFGFYRNLEEDNIPDWMNEDSEPEHDEEDTYDFDNDSLIGGHGPTSIYNPNDHCKRHRPRDDSPYDQEVSSYKRRKPR